MCLKVSANIYQKFKFNSCRRICDSCWKVGYLELYWKKLRSPILLCVESKKVLHDSELNKSICFAPKTLLGGKYHTHFPLFANPILVGICMYLSKHCNLNMASTLKHLKVNVWVISRFYACNAFSNSSCRDTTDAVLLATASLGAAILMTVTACEPE